MPPQVVKQYDVGSQNNKILTDYYKYCWLAGVLPLSRLSATNSVPIRAIIPELLHNYPDNVIEPQYGPFGGISVHWCKISVE